MSRAVLAHRAAAGLWAVLAVPAALWWREAVWFVIAASVWANVYAALAAAEGADDRRVLDRLDRLAELLGEHLTPGGHLMAPTLGHVVLYRLTDQDVEWINWRRDRLGEVLGVSPSSLGNPVAAGDVFPATIVRVWGPLPSPSPDVQGVPAVNLKVDLDGIDVLWATSVTEGDAPRCWTWPARIPDTGRVYGDAESR